MRPVISRSETRDSDCRRLYRRGSRRSRKASVFWGTNLRPKVGRKFRCCRPLVYSNAAISRARAAAARLEAVPFHESSRNSYEAVFV